jgi:hypothetical protein
MLFARAAQQPWETGASSSMCVVMFPRIVMAAARRTVCGEARPEKLNASVSCASGRLCQRFA